MIEDEIRQEIQEEKAERLEEPYLFPKEEMDSLIRWKPVSKFSIDEIYKDLPEAKRFHENYERFWLNKGR